MQSLEPAIPCVNVYGYHHGWGVSHSQQTRLSSTKSPQLRAIPRNAMHGYLGLKSLLPFKVMILKPRQSTTPCFRLVWLGWLLPDWATCYSAMPFSSLQSAVWCIISIDFYNKSGKRATEVEWPLNLFKLHKTSLPPPWMSKDYLSTLCSRITL